MADAHAHAKHHDYHLVDPSPWPIVGAISVFIMAVGAILWMHNTFAAAPFIFGIGFAGVAYTMIGWWRDVAIEATYKGDHSQVVQISHRYGMILFIASEVMFFVAAFWAYFNTALFPADVHQAMRSALLGCGNATIENCTVPGTWPPHPAANGTFTSVFDPWHLPLLNTLILLTSGADRHLGAPRAARERPQGATLGPGSDDCAWRAVHLRPGLRYTTPRSISPATSMARRSSWRPASTARTC